MNNEALIPSSSGAETAMQTLLPIRDVARATGVNPVTLRAWERRYGLIKPERTVKGHRLYSPAHIQQIQHVLSWLERGVAVSQVKRLLDLATSSEAELPKHWLEHQDAWMSSIEKLAEFNLDERFNQLSSLYPAETLYSQLLAPLLGRLQQHWSPAGGPRLEQVSFLTWLRSKLSMRVLHSNRLQHGAPLLLLHLAHTSPLPWLCAWLASHYECRVQVFDGAAQAQDLASVVSRLNARAVLLVSDQSLDLSDLQRQIDRVECPLVLCGDAVRIHAQQLTLLPELQLADDPLNAMQCLIRLGVLTSR